MKRKITPFLLLFLSLLCFLTTVALHFSAFTLEDNQDFEERVEEIQQKTEEHIGLAKLEAEALSTQLNSNALSFTSLLRKAKYPTFIFQDNQLAYWSEHTIVPDFEAIELPNQVTAISSTHGTFLIVPQPAKQYDIYVCVPLQLKTTEDQGKRSALERGAILNSYKVTLKFDKETEQGSIKNTEGSFLYAVDLEYQQEAFRNSRVQLLLLTLGLVFFVLFSVAIMKRFTTKGQYATGVAVFLALLVGMRFVLLFLNLPFAIAEIDLFDPKVYAASFWSPSVGDLALNTLVLATIGLMALYLFRKNRALVQLRSVAPSSRKAYLFWSIAGLYLLLAVSYQFYHGIYHNSPLVLDVTQSLELTKYKVIIYAIMSIHTLALCFFAYVLSTIVTVLLQYQNKSWPYKVLSLITAVLVLVSVLFASDLLNVVIVGSTFWLIIVVAAHHNQAVSFPYRTYLFFFLIVMVSAVLGALTLYSHYQDELKIYKQKFAFNILQDNDVLGEYLLEDLSEEIASDALIQMKMRGPYVDAGFIKRKISKQYLQDYFDKYETNVLLFDSEGHTLVTADTTAATLQELLTKYDTPEYRTERDNLFLVKDPSKFNARTYFKVIELPISKTQTGTIVLQLTLKKLLPNSVVPELLASQNLAKTFRTDMLSYAIYKQDKLWYSEGEYDYATNFNLRFLRQIELFNQGVSQESHHHLGVKDEKGNILIITTERYGGQEVLSNFSFLFLAFTAGLILIGLLYLLFQRKQLREFRPNFSTKIQLFLNFGILLPLLLVSIATAGLVTASYKKDLMKTYEKRGEAIQDNLSMTLTGGNVNNTNALKQRVSEIAAISEADINLYNKHGKLLVTSQPLIFEAGLLSKLINPTAYAAISEKQALRVLLQEQAGPLSFNAVYLPLKDEGSTGELLGFIGIPFFDSEKELDLKLIELITTTMNIFTVMFIMFMVLTFFASRALTVPLRMLAGKLKHTTLTGKNEMLAYEGADEIGMLVNEYNRMLLTLEQNKEDLAIREKEAAWREMARQVAHEIKNPLTPMKLSLQYLQKAIAENKPNTQQLIEKISHTLITQINILSDIATSFSNFTSMPEPKQEKVDIAAALRKSVDLHNDPATAAIDTEFALDEAYVIADESLMVRTFNNLLLNAIQAVPTSRKPHIKIGLQLDEKEGVLISIKDNGSGIPEDIRGKVFIPNFSTKYTGSGIGLAVAKKGIENAGGRIWFESEEGRGTTFYISLPQAKA